MKVLLFGATGMVGRGVLLECIRATDVERICTVGRRVTGVRDGRLQEIVRADLTDYSGLDAELSGFDACFFCLGISSAGMEEAAYTRVTYDIALAAATTLARLNPQMTFVFVSGMGTDATERGRVMWARVKGRTENSLRRLPFKAVYLFRPGFIEPLDGIRPGDLWMRFTYALLWPLVPLFRRLMPRQMLTTRSLGRAMLHVARRGAPKQVLEPPDINAAAAGP